ncbi:hypothetical protein CK203_064255 [Vitis vinifera]|uniref:Uncharacterized protein n=1 Tax=Vitis vinifera TaxID=29760 RepID=A0A438G3U4_VITVI|nr:hypothetical protein CK203_064255 [Vitis vinifera]
MPLSQAFQKLKEGQGHDRDHYSALRHAIQDLIDQGLVNLGQPSVTTNPLPTHSTHAMSPPPGDIHHIDLIKDDSIHRLSWDDRLPEPIVLHDSSEIKVETTTTLKGLIHMMTAGRATCIVFSDDDLPPEGLDHICPGYITVGCSGHKVPSILLDNAQP